MKNLNYQTQFNYVESPGIPTRGKTQTIEDQSLTVSQYLQRIQGGIMPPISQMMYPEDENDIQIRVKDLTDLDNFGQQINQVRASIKEAQKQPTPPAPIEPEIA